MGAAAVKGGGGLGSRTVPGTLATGILYPGQRALPLGSPTARPAPRGDAVTQEARLTARRVAEPAAGTARAVAGPVGGQGAAGPAAPRLPRPRRHCPALRALLGSQPGGGALSPLPQPSWVAPGREGKPGAVVRLSSACIAILFW